MDVVLAFFTSIDPFPRDSFDVQHLKEVVVKQLLSHVLRLIIVIKDNQFIDLLGLADDGLKS
jgi:hypothetical protein